MNLDAVMLKEVRLAGADLVLRRNHIYCCWPATNQPDYEERGLYFIGRKQPEGPSLLLSVHDGEFYIYPQ